LNVARDEKLVVQANIAHRADQVLATARTANVEWITHRLHRSCDGKIEFARGRKLLHAINVKVKVGTIVRHCDVMPCAYRGHKVHKIPSRRIGWSGDASTNHLATEFSAHAHLERASSVVAVAHKALVSSIVGGAVVPKGDSKLCAKGNLLQ